MLLVWKTTSDAMSDTEITLSTQRGRILAESVPTSDAFVRPHNKRNTRRWCKGKVGTEHQGLWTPYAIAKKTPYAHLKELPWEILVCQLCGKHLKLRRKHETDTPR